MKRLRVFIDSNILFSSAYRTPNEFEKFWILPDVDILTSEYSIDEVSRNLKSTESRVRLWHLIYRSHLVPEGETITLAPEVVLPPKDMPILLSAIAGQADLLVTGDLNDFSRHFGQIIQGVLVESSHMFKARYPEYFPWRGTRR